MPHSILTPIKSLSMIAAAALFALQSPASAQSTNLEADFDSAFGTQQRAPQSFAANYSSSFERQIAQLADGDKGRIGVAAIDLTTGKEIMVLGDQLFPMASTSKIAIAATYLEMVEQGRYSLTSEFPLLIPVKSAKYSSRAAPVRKGNYMAAQDLIEIMITRSSNAATDALIAAVGGTDRVNDWVRRQGIRGFSLDRDIATLVRDDGEYDPAAWIDPRDAATPRAMIQLLQGLYQGRYLSAQSRSVLLGAMSRTRTGKRRIRAQMPAEAHVRNKTGSLNNTSSDIGIIEAPDGRAIAVAIYVTGQGSRRNREARIASIARALYDGYSQEARRGNGRGVWTNGVWTTGG